MSAPACRSSSRKSKPRELFGFEDLAQPSPIVPRAAKIPSSKSPINKNNKSNTSKPAVKPKRSNILLSLKTEAKLADDAASFVAEHAREVNGRAMRTSKPAQYNPKKVLYVMDDKHPKKWHTKYNLAEQLGNSKERCVEIADDKELTVAWLRAQLTVFNSQDKNSKTAVSPIF